MQHSAEWAHSRLSPRGDCAEINAKSNASGGTDKTVVGHLFGSAYQIRQLLRYIKPNNSGGIINGYLTLTFTPAKLVQSADAQLWISTAVWCGRIHTLNS
jgi:hypothetical protein